MLRAVRVWLRPTADARLRFLARHGPIEDVLQRIDEDLQSDSCRTLGAWSVGRHWVFYYSWGIFAIFRGNEILVIEDRPTQNSNAHGDTIPQLIAHLVLQRLVFRFKPAWEPRAIVIYSKVGEPLEVIISFPPSRRSHGQLLAS